MTKDTLWDTASTQKIQNTPTSQFEERSYQGKVSLKRWQYKQDISIEEAVYNTSSAFRHLNITIPHKTDKGIVLLRHSFSFIHSDITFARSPREDGSFIDINFPRNNDFVSYRDSKNNQTIYLDPQKEAHKIQDMQQAIYQKIAFLLNDIFTTKLTQNNQDIIMPDIKEMKQALTQQAQKTATHTSGNALPLIKIAAFRVIE